MMEIPNLVNKKQVKDATEFRVGTDVFDELNDQVFKLLQKAQNRASANKRNTIYARDL